MVIELLLTFALSLPSPVATSDDIPTKYRKWLEEEVVYIISDRERDIFLQLANDAQRDRFIEEFWEQRDPTPGTEKNEYRDEHYRRIEYANKWLGRETRKPGWKTDQGRIYIQLGEPREIRRYHSSQTLVPLEMWFYEVDPNLGVPPFFYAIFFKKYSVGDFVLYDPTIHGPESLVFLSAGESFEQAAMKIADVDPELAQASINLVPTEMADIETQTRPTLSSVQLISQIENTPNYRRSAEYAERILRGEPIVETHYTFDPSNFASAFGVIHLGGGDSLMNYSFYFPVPKLEFGQYKDTVYTSMDVLFSVTTPEGKLVAERKHRLEEEFTEDQRRKIQQGGMAFEDHFLLIPGEYTVTLTVRNNITKVFYSSTASVEVPSYIVRKLALLGPMIFARSENIGAISPSNIPPYSYFSLKFHPILGEFLIRGQEIGVFYQVLSPSKPNVGSGAAPIRITYRLLNESGSVVKETSANLDPNSIGENGNVPLFWKFATADLELGKYKLVIIASDSSNEVQAESQLFEIRMGGAVAEPLTYYGPRLDLLSPEPALEKGRQLLNLGESHMASSLLKAACERWPGDNEVASLYAEALTEAGRLEEAVEVLLESSLRKPEEVEWKRKLGMLHLRLGNFNKAIGYLEQVRLQEGDSAEVLNPLGEAYSFTGNNEKAIEIWERSLQIESDQPLIIERLRQLRENPSESG